MADEILDYEHEFVFNEEYSQALDALVHEEGSVTSVADPSLIGSQEEASGGIIAPILVLSYLPSLLFPPHPLPSLTILYHPYSHYPYLYHHPLLGFH